MANKQIRSEPFKTSIARFSYVQNMFVRVVKKDNNKQVMLDKLGKEITEQQVTLIFDRATTDMTPFHAAISHCVMLGDPVNGAERFKKGLIRSPILAGDGKEARNRQTGEINPGMGADKFFIRCATRLIAPVRYKSESVPAEHGNGPDQVKSGDFGFGVIAAFFWTNKENGDGVSFGIEYLQKMYDGEALGGTIQDPAATAGKYFEAVAGTAAMAPGASADEMFR